MKLLRDDLISLPATEDEEIYYLEDPETGKKYEFNEQEYFLAEAIRKSYHTVVLLAKFNARFGSHMDREQLDEFLSRLDARGLLSAPEARAAVQSRDADEKAANDPIAENDDSSYPGRLDRNEIRNNFPDVFFLFRPERLLRILVYWFGFTRYLVKLLPVFVLVVLTGLLFNLREFSSDFTFSRIDFNLFQHLVFTLFTINLGNVLLKGAVASYFGVSTPVFGLRMAFGLVPRFSVPMKIPPDSPKKVKLWLSSSSIVIRAVLFCAGISIWLITREAGNELPLFGVSLAIVSMISSLFVINPLMDSDGYRLLATYFDKPDLRERAFRALKYSTFRQPEVVAQYVDTSTYLKVYAWACVLFIVLVLGIVFWVVANWLENHYRGFGVAVFLLLMIYLLRWYRASKAAKKKVRAGNAQGLEERNVDISKMPESDSKAKPRPVSKVREKMAEYGLVRLTVLIIFGICMFLPYPYESGGEAIISPYVFQKLYPETPGVIEHVYFDGGEFLEQGTVIAEMANYRQRRDVDVTQQEILKLKEELEVLLSTPSPEEIKAAMEKLTTAKLELEFSINEEARLAALTDEGFISEIEYERTVEDKQKSQQAVQEQEALLAALKAQVNPNEIDSIKLDIEASRRNLEYYQELLERTQLKMPFSGRIVTTSLRNLENTYLDEGDLFAEVEDSSRVKVEIMIPEADAAEIALGNRVRLKLEAFPDKPIIGEVTSIAPATTDSQFGAMLTVTSVVDNESMLLKSGMTGQAKIEAREMFAILAFTRSLIRFVRVEMWSWLP